MKGVLALLALLLALVSFSQAQPNLYSCGVWGCKTVGQECTLSNEVQDRCVGDTVQACNQTTHKCDPKPQLKQWGEPCVNAFDCEATAACINGVCNRQQKPGTPCTADAQCLYGEYSGATIAYTARCDSGKCYGQPEGTACQSSEIIKCSTPLTCANGKCSQPLGEGESCDNTDNCKSGLYCSSTYKCTAFLKRGDACVTTANQLCGDYDSCAPNAPNSTAGTCVERYSRQSGEPCYTLFVYNPLVPIPTQCAAGLAELQNCIHQFNKTDTTNLYEKCNTKFCDYFGATNVWSYYATNELGYPACLRE